jgi:hypothetical protein
MGWGVPVLRANGGEIADKVLAGLPVAPDRADEDGFERDIPAAPQGATFPADEHTHSFHQHWRRAAPGSEDDS